MRHESRALLALIAVRVAAGCGGSTNKANGSRDVGPLTLTLANLQPADVRVGEWVRAVRRLSDGAIRVDVRGRLAARTGPKAHEWAHSGKATLSSDAGGLAGSGPASRPVGCAAV